MPVEGGGLVMQPVGLDFGAVLAVAAAMGADTEFVASILSPVEGIIIAGLRGDAAEEYSPE